MRGKPAFSSSFHTWRSTRSRPSCSVLESISAGSMWAKRDKSSSASARRDTISACARAHVSARSFVVRLRKLSYSAARRRWRSFQTSASDGAPEDDAAGTADAAGPLVVVEGPGTGSPVSGSSEGAGGGGGGTCGEWAWRFLFMDFEPSVRQPDIRGLVVSVAPYRPDSQIKRAPSSRNAPDAHKT